MIGTRSGKAIAMLLCTAVAMPFFLKSYQIFQFTMVIIFFIVLVGLILLVGFNGQISLGHGAFYAIGAYSAAILMNGVHAPFWATLPVAALLGLGAGYLFGLPALRLEGHYLALATFALAIATPQILKHHILEKWTGGVQGIVLDQPEPPAWIPVDSGQWLYFVCLFIAIVTFLFAKNIVHGKVGRAITAIRDQPIAAAAMGIDVAKYKAITFGVSAMLTAIGGALSAAVTQFVAPDSFAIFLSITFFVGIVVGGARSLSGALFGALFLQFIPNFADQLSKAAPGIVFGFTLIAFVFLMPTGIAGLCIAIVNRFWCSRPLRVPVDPTQDTW